MNRYYKITTLLLVLALVSCYKDEPMTEPGQQGPSQIKRCLRNGDDVKMIVDPERLHKITPQRAELIAVNAASTFSANANTRAYAAAKEVSAVEPILSNAASGVAPSSAGTRAASAAADTLMYAVNFANEEGFALVSFDDRDGDILMYSENGNFDMSEVMASDDIMKFHVDMVMAYQQDKLNRIREAKAAGIEYVGELQMDTVAVEEFDMPTDLTENPYDQVATRAGMPGSGLPGGGSGRPGMPGLPGENCIPTNHTTREWTGSRAAIGNAQAKFGDATCFYPRVVPPSIFDNPPGGVWGDPGEGCRFPPYCNPPITNLDGYYEHYGAILTTSYQQSKFKNDKYVGLYISTLWSEKEPLNMYSFKNELNTGTVLLKGAPLAMALIMIYNEYPLGYMSPYPYVDNSLSTFILDMKQLKAMPNNKSLIGTPYAKQAAVLVKDISTAINEYYKPTTHVGDRLPIMGIRKGFNDFGFSIGYDNKVHNFIWGFPKISQSLDSKLPVFIYGIDKNSSDKAVKTGFAWIIDGYKIMSRIKDIRTFKFDESGNYNSSKDTYEKDVSIMIHAYMGLGSEVQYNRVWVAYDAYIFLGKEYTDLKILAGVAPRK